MAEVAERRVEALSLADADVREDLVLDVADRGSAIGSLASVPDSQLLPFALDSIAHRSPLALASIRALPIGLGGVSLACWSVSRVLSVGT